ncbi:UPF0568 protein C14orf166 homolog [Eurytemora carolleeae]|uniref:UPF0568 protein C14orf166 homolog n=1 Tax=Eurytemora carolleeae TaxID=1294199 RepID=UPI000C76495B|nr:UPF0568 protein C14orf166 homolog [Eurytemora carolleeae]|eukprot:XP_023342890.1 UPF0568 protein C14orf166 homolog [Eurytemora affinis]
MYRRKLTALSYAAADTFSSSSQTEYRTLVLWLEDQKIRHYKIDDRKGLRDINAESWPQAFNDYLTELGCTVLQKSPEEILDWLIGFAVRLVFGDDAEQYRKYNSEFISNLRADQPRLVSSNPLDNLDFTAPEFKAGVENLADFLQVTKHPDHLVTLQAICKLVSRRLSSKAIQNPKSVVPEGQAFNYKDDSLGLLGTGDHKVDDAAKILRLLYINDLRELQTRINEAIVSVQAVTANPKTDTRLGKVGR